MWLGWVPLSLLGMVLGSCESSLSSDYSVVSVWCLCERVVDLFQTVVKQLRLVIVYALVFFFDSSICQNVSNFGVPFTSYSGGTWR